MEKFAVEIFFMNIMYCIRAAIGSAMAQKLCIMTVTGSRKSA